MSRLNRIIAATVLSGVIALPAFAALKEGDAAPDFTTQASLAGKAFSYSLKEVLKKGPVVVYFYPSAYTNGCNAQAHAFAVSMDKFKAANATVVGVSLDNIARLNDFSADPEFCAGKLPVASDESGAIAKSYDLEVRNGPPGFKDSRGQEIGHGFTSRHTFVVTSDGKIAAVVGGNAVPPSENVNQALAAVEKLAAKK